MTFVNGSVQSRNDLALSAGAPVPFLVTSGTRGSGVVDRHFAHTERRRPKKSVRAVGWNAAFLARDHDSVVFADDVGGALLTAGGGSYDTKC